MDRFAGVNPSGQYVFPGFNNSLVAPQPAPKAAPPARGGIAPAAGSPTSSNTPVVPAGSGPGVAAGKKNAPSGGAFNPNTAVASRNYTGGMTLRAPGPKPKKPGECINCDKKKK